MPLKRLQGRRLIASVFRKRKCSGTAPVFDYRMDRFRTMMGGVSGIIVVTRNGLRGRDIWAGHGPVKAIYTRVIR